MLHPYEDASAFPAVDFEETIASGGRADAEIAAQQADPALYLRRQQDALNTAIVRGVARFAMLHRGERPTQLAQVQSHVFFWPSEASTVPSAALATDPASAIWASVELADDRYLAQVHRSDDLAQVPTVLWRELNMPQPEDGELSYLGEKQKLEDLFTPVYSSDPGERAQYKRWWIMYRHGEILASPEDALRIGAANDVMLLLNRVASLAAGLEPRSMERAAQVSGAVLHNLIPVSNEADAELFVYWDGVQTYRIQAKLPSGYAYDTMLYFDAIGGTQGAQDDLTTQLMGSLGVRAELTAGSIPAPFFAYEKHINHELQLIGMYDIVDLDQAVLLFTSASKRERSQLPE